MEIEKKVQNKERRHRIQDSLSILLCRFATRNGYLAFAPESHVRKHLGIQSSSERHPSHRIRQAMRRLERRRLLEWRKEGDSWRSRLTPAGKAYAQKIERAERILLHPKKVWDGKWRIVIFDVKEKYKSSRERFRRILQKAGFVRLQDSVWVYPHDCEELIALMRKDLRLGGSVLYLIAEGIENDSPLHSHFGL